MTKLKLEVRAEDRDTTRVYALSGDLYGDVEGYAFQEQVRRAIDDGVRRLVIDLANIRKIDSCGIGILAAITASGQKAGVGIVFAALPPPIENLLSIAWFLKWVDHAETVEQALDKLDGMTSRSDSGSRGATTP